MSEGNLPPEIIERVIARRGALHVYDDLDPQRTALVVIDLQDLFVDEAGLLYVPRAQEIVPNVNRLAETLRGGGGTVAFVQITLASKEEWRTFLCDVVSPAMGDRLLRSMTEGEAGHGLWRELDVRPEDLIVAKNRYSAFLPGASKLPDLLEQRNIDTILIAGATTTVCCESSARDAMMRDYRTIMVSDANADRTIEAHVGTLERFIYSFGDVMETDEAIAFLEQAHLTGTNPRGDDSRFGIEA